MYSAPYSRYGVVERVREHFCFAENPFAIIKHPDADEDSTATRCVYREERKDGTVLQCAVGCLIPVERYSSSWEGTGVGSIWNDIRDLFQDDVTPQFLATVQGQHDDIAERVLKGDLSEEQGRIELLARLNLIEELL